MNEYAEHAFCGGSDPVFDDGRILMRALYVVPTSKLEERMTRFFLKFVK